MPDTKSPHIHWLYLWLAISAAGNLVGLASIVDGLVIWADFFKHIIDLYREYIRGPIAFVGNHIWPFGKLPGWFFDVFIIYGIVLVVANIINMKYEGVSLVSASLKRHEPRSFIEKLFITIISLPLLPILVIFGWIIENTSADKTGEDQRLINEFMSYVTIIVAIFIVIILINFQIQRRHPSGAMLSHTTHSI
jgi:hypothetical protein